MPVALITAGRSRMGQGTAQCLIEVGWQVVLADIDEKGMAEVQAQLGGSSKVGTKRLDFTSIDDSKRVAAEVAKEYGSIDGLVNIGGGRRSLGVPRAYFIDTQPEHWQMILDANLKAIMNCCYAVIPYMIEKKKGVIVNMSASKGLRGGPKTTIYSMAKAGIINLGQTLAQELGPYNIRVNSIAPGNTESQWKPDITKNDYDPEPASKQPLGRRTSARDVGNMIAFLMSEKASYITGCCLDTSGGSTLH
jgi:3-oxoacyl-[acyl-carrier protein] reductase